MTERVKLEFRPRARLLQLLGDQLIKSPRLAVFELVKNSYDADARNVEVRIEGLGTKSPKVIVRDDGFGMSLKTVRDIWFVPAHDHKEKQKEAGIRTPLGRAPVGEKGVGRFAAHKLGNRIKLVTRKAGEEEVSLNINWDELMKSEFLSEAKAEIDVREPQEFTGTKTGTLIEIDGLRDKTWSRGDLRRLRRDIISICSPFDAPGEFDVKFSVPGRDKEFSDIPDTGEILKRAPWHFKFEFDGEAFSWSYEFNPPAAISKRIAGRSKESEPEAPLIIAGADKNVADRQILEGIGPVSGEFYAYDRGKELWDNQPEKQLVSNFLNENGGVRVYRDGVRVYNYGEEDDDWLGLDYRRFMKPAMRISRNIVIGAISIDLLASTALRDKTNREGFVENEAFERLKQVVLGAFHIFETERSIDKEAIRKTERKPVQIEGDKIRDPISEIRTIATREKIFEKIEPSLNRLEKNYNELRETMLQAGLSGLGLATVFHEIQHGVTALLRRAKSGASVDDIVIQATELEQLLYGISGLLRREEKSELDIADLVRKVRQASLIRFRSHRVQLVSPLLQGEQDGFKIRVNSRLFVGAVTNLLDNAFYWLRARWPSKPTDQEESPRKIFIGVSDDFEAGPALIIADTGPGFQDDPDTLAEPFFTRRPDGMGLGLYYARLVMELSGGEMIFPEREDVDVPEEFDGAVIAMVFPEK
ncbi:ATP-binding protein [Acidimangrovimonas sediminis]|uniref:ATP-binding protein n=1 Tax=Acidimangrovimonas sediminis TaxID=2056283 RepID=UPI0018ED02EC|nr:ATP-binding protein [Acidimangrovimonas sediminis]